MREGQGNNSVGPAGTMSTQANPLSDHWLDQLNQAERGIIKCGQEACARLSADRTWPDWIEFGEALLIGRMASMRAANRNSPRGRVTTTSSAGGSGITDLTGQPRFNHPATVLRHWKAQECAARPTKPKLASPSDLQSSIVQLSDENERLKLGTERGGELSVHDGEPDEIARHLLNRLATTESREGCRSPA